VLLFALGRGKISCGIGTRSATGLGIAFALEAKDRRLVPVSLRFGFAFSSTATSVHGSQRSTRRGCRQFNVSTDHTNGFHGRRGVRRPSESW
jgi:hypothetical protein